MTLSILNGFSQFFSRTLCRKFATKH